MEVFLGILLIFGFSYLVFAINWNQSIDDRLISDQLSSGQLNQRLDTGQLKSTDQFVNISTPHDHHQAGDDICDNENLDIELNIIEEMISSGYSKQILPYKNGTDVSLEIHINDIPHISEIGSFFELDLFYSEVWDDKRLAYGHGSFVGASRCIKNMTLDIDYLHRIWTPNVCIVNSRSAVIHSSPSDNIFIILYPNGRIWKNCRMLVRAPCSIDLRNFPFDTQTCSLLFESYSYNSHKVRLEWMDIPMTLMKDNMQLTDFTLLDYKAEKLGVQYPNGHWDQLKATFVFERRYGYFIWQAFVPSYMTVGVAYITFWMDPKELCTRATLSISAFLAICLQFGNVQQNQPRVSYIKAMDVWMLASILFMFGALMELAIISYVNREREKAMLIQRSQSISIDRPIRNRSPKHTSVSRDILADNYCEWQTLSEPAEGENGSAHLPNLTNGRTLDENGRSYKKLSTNWLIFQMNGKKKVRKRPKSPLSADYIDKIFLCLYPPTFLIFNIFYWWYYLSRPL